VKPGGGAILLGVATVVVLVTVVAGFLTLGSPQDERLRQLDMRRIDDLRTIATSVELAYHDREPHMLPDRLTDPDVLRYVPRGVKDPVTGVPYGYRVTGPQSYELCATFQAALKEGDTEDMDRTWTHPAGQACFEFTIDLRKGTPVPLRPSDAPAVRPTRPSGAR
jgi:hypothetical protein